MTENTDKKNVDTKNETKKLVKYLVIFVAFCLLCKVGCAFNDNEDKNNTVSTSAVGTNNSESETANITNSTTQKKYSEAGQETCNKIVNAINSAFNRGEFFKLLKLKATKSTLWYEDNGLVECTVYIQNNGDKIIKKLDGRLYFFDEDNVSDDIMIYISKVIRPNETIKYNIPGFIPKNITKAEIRNRAGDNIFNYDYTIDR